MSNTEANYLKLSFGATLNASGPHGSVGHDDCHNYGSVGGCDTGCPQLRRGECPVPEENKDLISELKADGVL